MKARSYTYKIDRRLFKRVFPLLNTLNRLGVIKNGGYNYYTGVYGRPALVTFDV